MNFHPRIYPSNRCKNRVWKWPAIFLGRPRHGDQRRTIGRRKGKDGAEEAEYR